MSLALFLRGSCTVSVPALFRTKAMDLCMQQGVQYTNFVWRDDGGICFCCTVPVARRFLSACHAQGVNAEILAYRGLPRLLGQIAGRAGLAVGAALAVALMVLSGLFVWDVQVSGNVTLSEGDVIEELQKCGFGVGSYLPNLQVREVENRVLMASEGIGWISINMVGTVARVQVIEHIEGENVGETAPTGKQAANLVAVCDGQIEYLELYRGNAVVKVGQAVKAGELLVSGLYDTPTGGFRFTRAAGRVMARTERTVEVEIPLLCEEKVYEASFLQEVEVCFFNFSQKIFKNSRNDGGSCDIIKEDHNLSLPFVSDLPFSVEVVKRQSYVALDARYTEEEALELAYASLARSLATLSEEAQLLEKQIETEWRDDAVVLRCTVKCIENIAVQSEIEMTEHP